jgi:hypothetical protein
MLIAMVRLIGTGSGHIPTSDWRTYAGCVVDAAEQRLAFSTLRAGFYRLTRPAILASVVQPSIHLPMLPSFLWGAVFIIRRQWLGVS